MDNTDYSDYKKTHSSSINKYNNKNSNIMNGGADLFKTTAKPETVPVKKEPFKPIVRPNAQPVFYEPNKKFENAVSRNLELYTYFLTESAENIKKEIYNNINLKINNENGNLINAVVENDALNENEKYEIIQDLIINNNIDIKSKNKYNQLPLHVACINEQYRLIELFIKHGSSKNDLDIYGNAPIHYLTKFIVYPCNNNDYYNKQNALEITKIPNKDDIKFFKMLTYGISKIVGDSELITSLKSFVSLNKFFDVKSFEKIIKEKMQRIKLLEDDYADKQNKSLKEETLFNEMYSEFKGLYNDFKVDETLTNELLLENITESKKKL